MVVGRLVFISFSVFLSVFMCFFVYLDSHIWTLTLGSQLMSQLELRLSRYTDQIYHKLH